MTVLGYGRSLKVTRLPTSNSWRRGMIATLLQLIDIQTDRLAKRAWKFKLWLFCYEIYHSNFVHGKAETARFVDLRYTEKELQSPCIHCQIHWKMFAQICFSFPGMRVKKSKICKIWVPLGCTQVDCGPCQPLFIRVNFSESFINNILLAVYPSSWTGVA